MMADAHRVTYECVYVYVSGAAGDADQGRVKEAESGRVTHVGCQE